jgi:hypothetical protein
MIAYWPAIPAGGMPRHRQPMIKVADGIARQARG